MDWIPRLNVRVSEKFSGLGPLLCHNQNLIKQQLETAELLGARGNHPPPEQVESLEQEDSVVLQFMLFMYSSATFWSHLPRNWLALLHSYVSELPERQGRAIKLAACETQNSQSKSTTAPRITKKHTFTINVTSQGIHIWLYG